MATLLGVSPAILSLNREIDALAQTEAPALVAGEPGTGKELVARLIHLRGGRHQQRFVAVTCSGLPETLLESELFGHLAGSFAGAYRHKPGLLHLVDGGSCFLDELGALSSRLQILLSRFLDTGEFVPIGRREAERSSARLIAATSCDLDNPLVGERFSAGLLNRFKTISVPPLRQRGADVRLLFAHFLERSSEIHHVPVPAFTPTIVETLEHYSWPGNVRELKRVAERLVAQRTRRSLDVGDLPPELRRI